MMLCYEHFIEEVSACSQPGKTKQKLKQKKNSQKEKSACVESHGETAGETRVESSLQVEDCVQSNAIQTDNNTERERGRIRERESQNKTKRKRSRTGKLEETKAKEEKKMLKQMEKHPVHQGCPDACKQDCKKISEEMRVEINKRFLASSWENKKHLS